MTPDLLAWSPEQYTAFWTAMYALAAIATAVFVGLAFFAARGQLNLAKRARDDAERDRHAQLTTELSRRWDEDELLRAREAEAAYDSVSLKAAMDEFYSENDSRYYLLLRVPNYFEDVGVMVTQGTIPLKVVEESLGSLITHHWQFWRLWIEDLRKTEGDPTNFRNFERLAGMLEGQSETRPAASEEAAEAGRSES
jgi:hypothetical protein